MRKRKETPVGEKSVLRAGAPGSPGITVEFTRYFDRSKLPPEQVERNMNGAVVSALKKSLASSNACESVNAAEMILKNLKIEGLQDVKLAAINIIIEYAVRKKEWFRIRPLLDHSDGEIREHANAKLESVVNNKGWKSV